MREAIEHVDAYADGSGYKYTVRVRFDARRRPVVVIASGGVEIEIDAASWSILIDTADRALNFVGDHPDGEAEAK